MRPVDIVSIAIGIGVLTGSGCSSGTGDGDPSARAATVEISPAKVRMLPGRVGLQVRARDANGAELCTYGQQVATITVDRTEVTVSPGSENIGCFGIDVSAPVPVSAAVIAVTVDQVEEDAQLTVDSLSRLASVASGRTHRCVIAIGGRLYCMGNTADGRTGLVAVGACEGALCDSLVTAVMPESTWVMVTAGVDFTCGLTQGGTAMCWGINSLWTLGSTATGDCDFVDCRIRPVPVDNGRRFRNIDANLFTACGVTPAGSAYCWGSGHAGVLGAGDTVHRATPRPVSGGVLFDTLAVGGVESACALAAGGVAWCWGSGYAGQLGTTSPDLCMGYFGELYGCSWGPVQVSTALRFTQIAVGDGHGCGLTVAGDAHCWGKNSEGQLGRGTTAPPADPGDTVPALVVGGLAFQKILASGRSTCGLTTQAAIHCWGGTSGVTWSNVPMKVSGSVLFEAAFRNYCGIAADSVAYCWDPSGATPVSGPIPGQKLLSGGLVMPPGRAGATSMAPVLWKPSE